DLDPSYKGKRPPHDDAAVAQLARVRDTLRAEFALLEVEGFEGDDIIATVTAWSKRQTPPLRVVIAGQDKDLLALLGENVNLLHIQSGNAWGPAEVQAKFGVRPDQMRDYLALVGDGSDNIKGVPKVGAVNAARLLKEFDSIQGILTALDETVDGEPKVK